MVNRNGHVSYGQDENCFARFHKHPYKGGMVREYNHKRVYTVEQFANMAESNLDNLGLGARTLHTKAKAFLAAHKDTKVAEKYAAQNEELKKQMEILAKSNKDMKDRLDSLEIKKKGKK